MREVRANGGTHKEFADIRFGGFDENTVQAFKFQDPDAAKTARKKITVDHETFLAREIAKRSPASEAKKIADEKAAKNVEQHKRVTAESEARRKAAAKAESAKPSAPVAAPLPPATPETAEPGQAPLNETAQDL